MFGVDYATVTRDPARLKKEGAKFACRYLSNPGNPKNLTPLEAASLKSHGVTIVTVWETTANRALSGFQGGKEDAGRVSVALVPFGVQRFAPVYFAVDFDALPVHLPLLRGYFKGAASVLGRNRVGCYGGLRAISHLFDKQIIRYGWQTYAWSGGRWDGRAHIRQYRNGQNFAGLTVDFDAAMARDFGQWDRPKIPVPKLKPKFSIRIEDGAGLVTKAWTTRLPALSLATWGVSRHNPPHIAIDSLS